MFSGSRLRDGSFNLKCESISISHEIERFSKRKLLHSNYVDVFRSKKFIRPSDEAFKGVLSRGVHTYKVVDKTSFNEHECLEGSPFLKNSRTVKFIEYLQGASYWSQNIVAFPLNHLNYLAWMAGLIPKVVKENYKDPSNLVVTYANYRCCLSTLSKYSYFNEGYVESDLHVLFKSIEHLHYRLKLPIDLMPPSRWDIEDAQVNPDTSPGLITRRLYKYFGVKDVNRIKKIDIIHDVVKDLFTNWWRISKGLIVNNGSYYYVGSREKINNLEIGDEVKTRPLFIPEFIDLLHGSTWWESFKLQWAKTDLFSSELWLGHADENLRYMRRLELTENYKYSYEFDGKSWDSSVTSDVIIEAFNILASCYKRSDYVKNHFSFIVRGFIEKKLILHNGNIFNISHGVGTGNTFTSIINSLVNWIIYTITIHNCPKLSLIKDDYELQILGDDIVIWTNKSLNETDINEMITYMRVKFNYSSEFTKEAKESVDGKAVFLRKFINEHGILDVREVDLWEKLLLGPDFKNLRKSRLSYFLRRLNSLTTLDKIKLSDIGRYFAFIEIIQESNYNEKVFYSTHYYASGLFTLREDQLLQNIIFSCGKSMEAFNRRSHYWTDRISFYTRWNLQKWSDKLDYKDYWVEVDKRDTVGNILRGYNREPINEGINFLSTLHKRQKS